MPHPGHALQPKGGATVGRIISSNSVILGGRNQISEWLGLTLGCFTFRADDIGHHWKCDASKMCWPESAVFVQPSRTWTVVRWERVGACLELIASSRVLKTSGGPFVVRMWYLHLDVIPFTKMVYAGCGWVSAMAASAFGAPLLGQATRCTPYRTPHFRLSLPNICIQMFEWTHQCPQKLPGLVRGIRLSLGGSFSLRSKNNRNQAQVVSTYPSKRGAPVSCPRRHHRRHTSTE